MSIESPKQITRRVYRIRQNGRTSFYPDQTAAHYSDRPRVAYRANKTHDAPDNYRFRFYATKAWGELFDTAAAKEESRMN